MSRRGLPSLSIYYLGLLLLLYFPIGVLVLFSINDGTTLAFPLRGLTLHWYQDMLGNRQLLTAVRNSALVAITSSLAATALGSGAAIGVLRFKVRGQLAFVVLALMPLLVPFLILGVALLILYAALDLPRSLLTVAIGHTVVSLPYTLLIVMARLVGFPSNLEEAAADLGAGYPYTLRRVVLPLIAPGMLAAWLVAFTVSFDEFVLASFLIGRDPTLPVFIVGQLRFANRFPQVVALAIVVMAVSLSLVVLAEWLQRRGAVAAVDRAPVEPVTEIPVSGFTVA